MTPSNRPNSRFLPNWEEERDRDLEKILERHLPWIRSHVHRKLGDFRRSKGETGDFVQEAMVQFLKHGPRIQLSNDRQLRALLGKIVENVICDKYAWFTAQRRNMARERPLPPDSMLMLDPPQSRQKTPSKVTQQQEQEAWARLGLELLEPRDREVVILHHWEDLSFSQIGKMLEISKVAARKRYIQASYRLLGKIRALQSGRIEAALGPEMAAEAET
jgi:RNA polymerase sigma-70 factor (ECF subfamily)